VATGKRREGIDGGRRERRRLSWFRGPRSARICVRFAAATRLESPQSRHIAAAVRVDVQPIVCCMLSSCRWSGTRAPLSRAQSRCRGDGHNRATATSAVRNAGAAVACSRRCVAHHSCNVMLGFCRLQISVATATHFPPHPHRRASGALRLDRVRALFAPRAGSP